VKRWNNNQASQRIYSPIQTLATFGGSTGAPGITQFRLTGFDARLRMLLALIFSPPAGANLTTVRTALAGTGSLWLYEEQQDRSGVQGLWVPCTNLAGSTQAAPISIPADSGLMGYAREFVSGADAVGGQLTAAGGPAGTWSLQVSFTPEQPGLNYDEFEQLAVRVRPEVVVGPVSVA